MTTVPEPHALASSTTARQRLSLVHALPALAALAGLSALGWAWLARPDAMTMGGSMGTMVMPRGSVMSMPMSPASAAWTPLYAAQALAMWTAMAVAMMLPTVAPTLLRLAKAQPGTARRTLAFAGGYLLPWLVFAVAATLLQWGLEQTGVVTGGVITDLRLGSLMLAAAGIFQLLPLKRACLARCTALGLWNGTPGAGSAAAAGMRYAGPCLGASGALMFVPLASGLMNAPWLAGLTAWLLLERASRWGGRVAWAGGLALLAYAAARLWI